MAKVHDFPLTSDLPDEIQAPTLRRCFEEYRDLGGACWVDSDPPEMSVASEQEQISCLVRCRYVLGLPNKTCYIGPPPSSHDTATDVVAFAHDWVKETILQRYLWCPPGCVNISRLTPPPLKSTLPWSSVLPNIEPDHANVMEFVSSQEHQPLVVSTIHAALEVDRVKYRSVYSDLYVYPRTTAPSAGIFGTDHNNSFIDMSPYERDKEPDREAREYKSQYIGYICPGHTSHSYEAGKSRRVAKKVKVRLLNSNTLATLRGMLIRLEDDVAPKSWKLLCLGQFAYISEKSVRELSVFFKLSSLIQDPGVGLYVHSSVKLVVICIAPGTLTRECDNRVWSDSYNTHVSERLPFTLDPVVDPERAEFKENVMSFHYGLIPFVEHNAAIRTSISSTQITQAVCLPFCPATAAVSPANVFKPIVTTPVYAKVMEYQRDTLDVASYLPGENVSILYLNHELNYEDSIMVSSRYAELGGFSTVSVCRYLLPATDYVPPVGSTVCSVLSPWWKSKCSPQCKHTKDYVETSKALSPFYTPTATLIHHHYTKTGEQSVRVKSFEQFQTGNKLSTGHGQKGVATVVPYEDMPVCLLNDGTSMIPDVVMAMSSIITRQTLGQLYESAACWKALRGDRSNTVVETGETEDLSEEVVVLDGCTGEPYHSLVVPSDKDGKDTAPRKKLTRATLGFMRMFNQSQMTRERHFTSHRSMTENTLRTPTKRSKGGSLNQGEMEVQASVAAGLISCTSELRKRGDEVIVLLCTSCQRLRLLHSCTNDTEFVEITLPYDTVVLDCVTRIIHNVAFRYTIEPDI